MWLLRVLGMLAAIAVLLVPVVAGLTQGWGEAVDTLVVWTVTGVSSHFMRRWLDPHSGELLSGRSQVR